MSQHTGEFVGNRKQIRLRGYDYSLGGAYFITICTYKSRNIFGSIVNGAMHTSSAGDIAERCWKSMEDDFSFVTLDTHAFMPNHFHGILVMTEGKKKTLGQLVCHFKARTTQRIREQLSWDKSIDVWQRSFYDRIILSERVLNAVRQYILDNTVKEVVKREEIVAHSRAFNSSCSET